MSQVFDERASKEALHALWDSLDRAERTEGIPNDPTDLQREDQLLRAIKQYEASEDYQSYLASKSLLRTVQ